MDGNSWIRSSFVLSFVVKIRPLMDGNVVAGEDGEYTELC